MQGEKQVMQIMTRKKKHMNMIERFKRASHTMRAITLILAFILTCNVFTTPAFAAGVKAIDAQSEAHKAKSSDRMSENLEHAQRLMALLDTMELDDEARSRAVAELETVDTEIGDDEAAVLEQFEAVAADLKARHLPQEILDRHDAMLKHYKAHLKWSRAKQRESIEQHSASLLTRSASYAKRLLGANDDTVEFSIDGVDTEQFERRKQHNNPNRMPTQILKPNPNNTPKSDKADFTLSGYTGNPLQHYAALGDLNYNTLPGADDPAYLGESDEIVLSDAIKAKAAELGYDAVKIFHWVRNNITWIPSWGSSQNAQLTLETLRGNAFDIATLTIALFRASKIPARYVHGTITVPAEKFKNWAGGFEDINAAMTYAASAGIPMAAMMGGGGVTDVQMEHIWVEAATDFYPSRGARNFNADSWAACDPSFKQYTYQEGIDALHVSGIDTEALVNNLLASAEINETTGAIKSIDTSALENALTQAQGNLESYIENNMTDPSVLDVIGGAQTIIEEYSTLPSSLPNPIVATGARYAKVPASLQQRVSISMQGSNSYDYAYLLATGGDLSPNITLPYAKVNNERVTLSFKPATQADEDTIASYIPEGNITDVSQLPSSLPAYLINVIPQVKVNGSVVLEAQQMRLGEELDVMMQPYVPGIGSLGSETHTTIAGSYLSLNVIAQGVSPQKLKDLQSRLEQTKNVLESSDQAQLAALTREEILGDMMYAGSLSYFAQLQGQSEMAGLAAKARTRLVASNGIFGYEPKVTYLYGMPRTISAGGIHLDIPMTMVTSALDNNHQKMVDFTVQVGTIGSALEHQVPEQMFNTDPANPTQAISAVKALQIANQTGQSIYRIDSSNINTVLPNIHTGIQGEIQSAVNSGKYVITHTDNVSVPGWSGCGYIVIDPLSGAGAYMISGGDNGAFYLGLGLGLLLSLARAPLLSGIAPYSFGFAHLLVAAIAAIILYVSLMAITLYTVYGKETALAYVKCFIGGLLMGMLAFSATRLLGGQAATTGLGIITQIIMPIGAAIGVAVDSLLAGWLHPRENCYGN